LLKDGQIPSAAERYIKSLTHIQKMFDLNPEQTKVLPASSCFVFVNAVFKASKELALSCHLNLAMCFIKLEAWTKVIDNCEKALLIDLSNSKALYRRASALYMKKDYKLALSDLRRASQEDAAVCALAGHARLLLFTARLLLFTMCFAGAGAHSKMQRWAQGRSRQTQEDVR
jgi:heat shock protein 4